MTTLLWPVTLAGRRRQALTWIRDARSLLQDAVTRRRLVDAAFSARLDALDAEGGTPVGLLAAWLPSRAALPPRAAARAREDAGVVALPAGGGAPPPASPRRASTTRSAVAELASSALRELSRLDHDLGAPSTPPGDPALDRPRLRARAAARVRAARGRSFSACAADAIAELRRVEGAGRGPRRRREAGGQGRGPGPGLLRAAARRRACSERAARAALLSLLDEYDYWSDYIDWYFDQQTLLGVRDGPAGRGRRRARLGPARAPRVLVLRLRRPRRGRRQRRQQAPAAQRLRRRRVDLVKTLVRLLVGLVASVVGFGLLSTHVVSLNLGDTKLEDVIGACVDGGAGPCKESWALILIALGLLFGFSERALTTFEDKILQQPRSKRGRARATPPLRLARLGHAQDPAHEHLAEPPRRPEPRLVPRHRAAAHARRSRRDLAGLHLVGLALDLGAPRGHDLRAARHGHPHAARERRVDSPSGGLGAKPPRDQATPALASSTRRTSTTSSAGAPRPASCPARESSARAPSSTAAARAASGAWTGPEATAKGPRGSAAACTKW